MTAHAMSSQLSGGMAAGMDGCITKPVMVADLRRALAHAAQFARTVDRRGSNSSQPLDGSPLDRSPLQAPGSEPSEQTSLPSSPSLSSQQPQPSAAEADGDSPDDEPPLSDTTTLSIVRDAGLLAKVVESFATYAVRHMQQLRDAVRDSNWSDARKPLHTLKGSAANLGAAKLV